METQPVKQEEKLPQLMKMSSSYKIVVPEDVESKIRYLLRKFPSTEWSGVLFYSHEGTFENGDLVITCKDIYPMDLGNSTYTEFFMSEEVTGYIADNCQELWDCDLGLIHSHHNMKAFFSGTDTNTLQSEGNERNCFVSLIVSNDGDYAAAITRKVQKKSEVMVKSLGESYEFFGEGLVQVSNNSSEVQKVVDTTTIQYFNLDVERHETSNPFDYLDNRFNEIEERKRTARIQLSQRADEILNSTHKYGSDFDLDKEKRYTTNFSWDDWENSNYRTPSCSDYSKDLTLWDKKTMDEMKVENPESYIPDQETVKRAVAQLISCSLFINPDKFDLKTYVEKHIDNRYNEFFGENRDFSSWCDMFVEFILTHFDDPQLTKEEQANFEGQYWSEVAMAIEEELLPYNKNAYIAGYCMALETFIV